jgi:hypothetical protein
MRDTAYRTWTSPDGLIAVEIDADGAWLRTRQHPADMWEAPIEMLAAGGVGTLTLSSFYPKPDLARDGTPILARDDEGRAI